MGIFKITKCAATRHTEWMRKKTGVHPLSVQPSLYLYLPGQKAPLYPCNQIRRVEGGPCYCLVRVRLRRARAALGRLRGKPGHAARRRVLHHRAAAKGHLDSTTEENETNLKCLYFIYLYTVQYCRHRHYSNILYSILNEILIWIIIL
jgi:hypothetical protein